jgi:hypothetical protein
MPTFEGSSGARPPAAGSTAAVGHRDDLDGIAAKDVTEAEGVSRHYVSPRTTTKTRPRSRAGWPQPHRQPAEVPPESRPRPSSSSRHTSHTWTPPAAHPQDGTCPPPGPFSAGTAALSDPVAGAQRSLVHAALLGVLKGNNPGCRELPRQIIRGLAVPQSVDVPEHPARDEHSRLFVMRGCAAGPWRSFRRLGLGVGG